MSEIRTKPVTPEYEKAWDRIFGYKKESSLSYQFKNILDKRCELNKESFESAIKEMKKLSNGDVRLSITPKYYIL